MAAMMKTSFIALSCVDYRNAALPPVQIDNARSAKNENEIYERYNLEPRELGSGNQTIIEQRLFRS
jgi:hypothetical protein